MYFERVAFNLTNTIFIFTLLYIIVKTLLYFLSKSFLSLSSVFPKTDYTYSEKSTCRYEIAPGILAMPNMSRRSIHSNTENSNQFSYTPPENDICESTNIEKEKETKTENSTVSIK